MQVWLVAQAFPQLPQLAGSVLTLVQPVVQFVSPASGQPADGLVQTPVVQLSPVPQTSLQPPQLFGSVRTLTQEPPQSSWLEPQVPVQDPCWQV
jgi:hypothetical protein